MYNGSLILGKRAYIHPKVPLEYMTYYFWHSHTHTHTHTHIYIYIYIGQIVLLYMMNVKFVHRMY